jgi:hypothetical protein
VPEGSQRVYVLRHAENDISPPAAITAIRATAGHVFFPVEVDSAISPFSRFYVDLGFIDQHGTASILFLVCL